ASQRSGTNTEVRSRLAGVIVATSQGPLEAYSDGIHPVRFLGDLRRLEQKPAVRNHALPFLNHYGTRLAATWRLESGQKALLNEMAEIQGLPRRALKISIVQAALVRWANALRAGVTVRIDR